MSSPKTYFEKLQNPRWQRKRLKMMEHADFKCEDCGRKDLQLQIHHSVYIKGREPWEYTNHTLICVCERCHIKRGDLKTKIESAMAVLLRHSTPDECDEILKGILDNDKVRGWDESDDWYLEK